MGTRGFVGYYPDGIKTPETSALTARGVYNHFDSYPRGLLKDIVRKVQNEFNGDWRAFVDKYVEKRPAGGSILDATYDDVPDAEVSPLSEFDPLFQEWCYILHEGGIDVLANREDVGQDGLLRTNQPEHRDPNVKYGWALVAENVPYTISEQEIKQLEAKCYE